MLRVVVLALLLANLFFFAWARGWLAPGFPAPTHGDREPERVAAQVRPELMTVMSSTAAGVALAAASAASAVAGAGTGANTGAAAGAAAGPVCLEAGPFSDADIGAAQARLVEAALPVGSWRREQVARAGGWAVYFGRFADTATMRAKEEELRRLQLPLEPVKAPPELVPGLILPALDKREAADAALAALALRGVRTARVVALPPPPLQHWLRVAEADSALQARLVALQMSTTPAATAAAASAAAATGSAPAAAAASTVVSVLGAGFSPCVRSP